MKKIMALAMVVSLLLLGASPALARGRFHGPGPGGGPFWAALGLGLLAGAVVVDLLNEPQPVCPPPRAVVIAPAPPVVTQSVPAPRASENPAGAVVVNAALLNIRSGPGFQNPVVAVVQKGDSLVVHSTTQGWLYVQSPTGRFGWVARQFTSPVSSPASG